ncbi:DNA-3-methyladenine glycosylase [Helicobacter sp. MIT 99-5507]|uniref:DNA-3-methyladenine glycosylase family protein n=1 Tax=Helicobacter sp. MIT 99-5507 TaxID=152489 RepID=UPI000E1ECF97|nr:DNA-3-methyladenine glycosylase [Helicobacter sp. MIT 99-5507]RDU57326.1 DNA-3-methyladenine glycosylase 2 family protein [Helicobacter sp. MIT 99-5507]
MHFKYDNKETQYLKSKCKKLALIIDEIGHINRTIDKDLFSAVIHHIIGQQISTKAQKTIWQRIEDDLKVVNTDTILKAWIKKLQSFGMTFKKAEYIIDFANKIKNDEFDLEAIWQKTDEDVIKELSALKGIGVWTAEMILLFCMERKNVFSYGDLAIQRGIRMVYHHKKITKSLFEKYKKRFSPYYSVASLYFWAVAGGVIDGMRDYAPIKQTKVKKDRQEIKIAGNKK